MANITYLDMVNVMQNYYRGTTTPDAWVQFTSGGITAEKLQLLEQAGVHATISPSGNVLGYDYNGALPAITNPASVIDSNLDTGSYGVGSYNAQIPGTAIVDQQSGITTMQSGVKTVSSGATIASLADKVSLGVAGVALGTKLGALIDGAIYSIAPDWWDEHYPTINPATWDDIIAGDNETGQWVVRSIFGLPDDQSNNGTMYIDERLLAYSYAMLLENGAWNTDGYDATPAQTQTSGYVNITRCPTVSDLVGAYLYVFGNNPRNQTTVNNLNSILSTYGDWYCFRTANYPITPPSIPPISTGQTACTFYIVQNLPSSADAGSRVNNAKYFTINMGTFGSAPTKFEYTVGNSVNNTTDFVYQGKVSESTFLDGIVANVYWFNGVVTPVSGIEGINPNNPEASTHITPSNVINVNTGQPITPQDSIDDILDALKLAYPALFANELYEDVLQPDGTVDRITYTPVPYPDMEDPTKPVTDTTEGVDPQTNPEYNPDTRPEEQTQGLTDSLTESTNTPDTGSGTTPPFLPPDGTANALYAIYNPSQAELNSFGAWLWSSNFVDQLLKLFNDPMQAIIGLHKVFVNPVISGRQNIKVGYLDSGVASNVVGAQYVTVDCGSVTIPEYFGNVFDYDPFTQIYLYLPFVGIQRLDTGDVMRGTLNVIYHCDVLTGACLVEVNVYRDGGGGIIYTYTGNCAVQYPISSGSYMGIIASLASVVGGVVGTIATGGALAPVALGAVSGVMNAHTRVEHSGGFSGNAGAMGIKKPYVIITRPQTCLADNFPAFNGYPANKLTYIGDCTGYIKCDECHVEQIPGTDSELSELENLLKSGIII